MFDLAMAAIRDLNFTTAAMVAVIAISFGVWLTNRSWSRASERKAELEHTEKMYQYKTEREVKLSRLSEHPATDPNMTIEHRNSDTNYIG